MTVEEALKELKITVENEMAWMIEENLPSPAHPIPLRSFVTREYARKKIRRISYLRNNPSTHDNPRSFQDDMLMRPEKIRAWRVVSVYLELEASAYEKEKEIPDEAWLMIP